MIFLRHILLITWLLIFVSVFGQDWGDMVVIPDTMTAKENSKLLFKGFALQTAGIGLIIASVYVWNEFPEDQYEIPLTGFGVGVSAALVGSFWIFASSAKIIKANHSMHHKKKAEKYQKISFKIEPTPSGVGLVCRF